MRLQTKLFILLVVIAVLPLAALSWRSQLATERLGMAIAERSRAVVSSQIENQLRQVVGFSATILYQEQRAVELLLRLQAEEVERRLAGEVPSRANPVYFHNEFDDPDNPPPGTAPSSRHFRVTTTGESVPIMSSEQHQAFFLPISVEEADVAGSILRLATLEDAYAGLNAGNEDVVFWQFTSLEDGTHSVFPGHGGYPPEYDPRERNWYRLAKASGQLVWTPPMIDASTRQLLLTVAMPVYGPDGSFAGVTGIDVQILGVLNDIQSRLGVGEQAEGFIVRIAEPDGDIYEPGSQATPELRIVAYRGYQLGDSEWDMDIEAQVLTSGEQTSVQAVIDDLLAERSGVRRISYQNQDSLWVYGQLQRLGASLVYIVPYTDVVAVAEEAQSFIRVATDDQTRVAGIASITLIVLVGILAIFAARSVTGPLRDLAQAAARLAAGDFDSKAPVFSRDEVGDVAETFNAMVPQLKENMSTRSSLALAYEIQQKLLPERPPRIAGLDIAGRSVYCDQTGGDYYDFMRLHRTEKGPRVGIAVGDVTGHGIPSALTMTTVRALLRASARHAKSLAGMIEEVNAHLAEDSTGGRFVTLVVLVVEPEARIVRWVNAGHDPVIVYEPATDTFSELEALDIPLAVQSGWRFREGMREHWSDDAILVIGTDGIWEARNEKGEMFGKDGLREVVRRHAHRPAETICEAVSQALDAFRGKASYRDDVTLVVIKFTKKETPVGDG